MNHQRRLSSNRHKAALAAIACSSIPAHAQPAGQFYLLPGSAVTVHGVSDTGVVLGELGSVASRWTIDGGAQLLGTLPGHTGSTPAGVTRDGSVVFGTSRIVGGNVAFRWTAAGMQPLLPAVAGQTFCYGMSADAAFATGTWTLSETRPYVLSEQTGFTVLPVPAGFTWATPQDVSSTGTVIGSAGIGSSWRPYKWVGGSPEPLPVPNEAQIPLAMAVSEDGRTAVGMWLDPGSGQRRAVRWVDGGQPELLPQGIGEVAALDVNADGSVMVGYTTDGACRWYGTTAEDLTARALAMGAQLGGARLGSANAVSTDGVMVAGHVYLNGQYRGWLMVIPPGGCAANCDASTQEPILNAVDFTCFLQKFAAGHLYANCDGSTTAPTLNVADFTCFLQRFAAGCP